MSQLPIAIGRAVADKLFYEAFLKDPIAAMEKYGFMLTEKEASKLRKMSREDLAAAIGDISKRISQHIIDTDWRKAEKTN